MRCKTNNQWIMKGQSVEVAVGGGIGLMFHDDTGQVGVVPCSIDHGLAYATVEAFRRDTAKARWASASIRLILHRTVDPGPWALLYDSQDNTLFPANATITAWYYVLLNATLTVDLSNMLVPVPGKGLDVLNSLNHIYDIATAAPAEFPHQVKSVAGVLNAIKKQNVALDDPNTQVIIFLQGGIGSLQYTGDQTTVITLQWQDKSGGEDCRECLLYPPQHRPPSCAQCVPVVPIRGPR